MVYVACQICITSAWADDITVELQQAQKAGDDARIIQCCNILMEKSPENWLYHYVRANALLNLGRTEEARAEYSYTLSHTGDSHIAQYCRDALEPPTSGGVNQVTARISKQAASVGNSSLGQGKSEQANWAQTGITQARAVPDRAANMAKQRVRYGDTYVPKYTPEQIQYQHNLDVDEKYMDVVNAKAKGDAHYQAAQEKTSAADTAAANLSSQFNATSKNGFHLSEQGTNFYVRQYAPAAPSGGPNNPAHVSISDSANSKAGDFQSPLQARANALNPAAQKALDVENAQTHKSNLYGHLLPQNKP